MFFLRKAGVGPEDFASAGVLDKVKLRKEFDLGEPLAPTNVATRKYQIWVSLFPGGNFLAKFSYKFLHRWSCTQTAQIALEYYSHTMGVWKSIY